MKNYQLGQRETILKCQSHLFLKKKKKHQSCAILGTKEMFNNSRLNFTGFFYLFYEEFFVDSSL